jgi:hypothetical protein
MAEIDKFASLLFEESKRFYELALLQKTEEGKNAFLHTALLLAISSMEAHVNAIADELLLRKDLAINERSILTEKEISIEHGEFVLSNVLKIYRTLDRVEFIHNRFGRERIDYRSKWWSQLGKAFQDRNSLVHPKDDFKIEQKLVKEALEGVLGALNSLYLSLYKKNYPPFRRGLNSKMTF